MGKLVNWKQEKKQLEQDGKAVHLVQKYIDKSGKQRWKGTKSLRSSESGTQLTENTITVPSSAESSGYS